MGLLLVLLPLLCPLELSVDPRGLVDAYMRPPSSSLTLDDNIRKNNNTTVVHYRIYYRIRETPAGDYFVVLSTFSILDQRHVRPIVPRSDLNLIPNVQIVRPRTFSPRGISAWKSKLRRETEDKRAISRKTRDCSM